MSELMLQQTQVSRVEEVFESFISRFPTPQAMVDAGQEAVVAAWKGLGYYRRARMLHAAAQVIVTDHGGVVPQDPKVLETLPGVGRYTAGAISSIIFGEKVPIVDGNIARVLARLDDIDLPHGDPALLKRSWVRAEELVKSCGNSGVLNEGLMELGASVCLPAPRGPSCQDCPLKGMCRARRTGREKSIPSPKPKTSRTIIHHHVIGIHRKGRWLLQVRPDRGHWGGMWEPLSIESQKHLSPDEIVNGLPIRIENLKSASASFKHLLSHREIRIHLYTATTRARSGTWCNSQEIKELAMSTGMHKALSRLQEI